MRGLLFLLLTCLSALGLILYASPPRDCVCVKVFEKGTITTYGLEDFPNSPTFKEIPLEYLQDGLTQQLDYFSLKAVCILVDDSARISSILKILEVTDALKLKDIRLLTIPDSTPNGRWQVSWEFRLWNEPEAQFKPNE